jgi:hypothetical protein
MSVILSEEQESRSIEASAYTSRLEARFPTLGRPYRFALQRLVDIGPMIQESGAQLIAELTEHVSELSILASLERAGVSRYETKYNSVYNRSSPVYGSNDRGADFEICFSDGQLVKIEVEQRASGYTPIERFEREVKRKLGSLPRGNGIYVFFNGYETSRLSEVESWAEEAGIRIVTAPPVPYVTTNDGLYDFDFIKVGLWFQSSHKLLTGKFYSYFQTLLNNGRIV